MPTEQTRFVVFGCRPQDTLLVEVHTDDFSNAAMLSLINSTSDFKARIWDDYQKGFVKQKVIDEAIKFYSM